MEYRNLGRTGVKVSPLCLGCMMFGAKTEPEESYRIIDHAIESGINFLDTANVYSIGKSETIVGEALKRNGKRDRIILATKVHGNMDKEDPNGSGNNARHIIQQCDASLKRLQTDWIDLYQIHRPQSTVPIDETLSALDTLIRAGKVRYIGASTFAAWQLMEAIMISRELGLHRFICEQPPYNLLERRAERELIPFAQTYGFGVIPWSPMAGGLLSGKYKKDAPKPEGTRFSKPELAGRFTPQYWEAIEKYEAICEANNVPVSQLALAWSIHQPGITSPIIGPRTFDQLVDNLAALDITITPEIRTALDTVVPPGGVLNPLYQADFGPHTYR